MELYHYNHNHDALGRFANSPGGSISSRSASKNNKRKNSIQYKRKEVKKKRVSDYKNIRLLSDEELKDRIARLELEKRYRSLAEEDILPGKDAVNSVLRSSANAAASTATSELTKKALKKASRS